MTGKQYKIFVLAQGCIVTGETGPHVVPHHAKCFNSGFGQVSDFFVIPLVNHLHTGYKGSFHHDRSLFEDQNGREMDLLARTIERAMTALKNNEMPF